MGFQERQWIHMIHVERAGQQMVSAILVRPSHPLPPTFRVEESAYDWVRCRHGW